MSEDWEPTRYTDSFQARIMALVERKAHEGKLETVGPAEEPAAEGGAEVIDLAELLKRSLGRSKGDKPQAPARSGTAKKAAKTPSSRKKAG